MERLPRPSRQALNYTGSRPPILAMASLGTKGEHATTLFRGLAVIGHSGRRRDATPSQDSRALSAEGSYGVPYAATIGSPPQFDHRLSNRPSPAQQHQDSAREPCW